MKDSRIVYLMGFNLKISTQVLLPLLYISFELFRSAHLYSLSVSLAFLLHSPPPFWIQGDCFITEGAIETNSRERDPRLGTIHDRGENHGKRGFGPREKGKIRKRGDLSPREKERGFKFKREEEIRKRGDL